jgi:transposase
LTAALRRGCRPRRQLACDIGSAVMKSTIGRPRLLTDDQVAIILAWHEEVEAWRAMGAGLKSRRQLASELGVSLSTISSVIARRGQYKQSSPDARNGELDGRHQRFARLRTRGFL